MARVRGSCPSTTLSSWYAGDRALGAHRIGPAAADSRMTPHHSIRVLLVDDQAMIGEAVRRMLAAEPEVEFRYCSDPTKAMQEAAEFQPW